MDSNPRNSCMVITGYEAMALPIFHIVLFIAIGLVVLGSMDILGQWDYYL